MIEVPGWQGRGHGGMTAVKGVVCHWTASPDTYKPTDPYPSLGVVRDGRSGLPGPLAQLGLGRDGAVYVIAAGLAYHAGVGYWKGIGANGNAQMLGIEAESTGSWTAAQVDAYTRLVAALRRRYGVPLGNIVGHHEWAPGRKIDIRTWPGGMVAFRATVHKLLTTAPVVPDVPEEDDMVRFLRGDSEALDANGVPWGYRVFKVEYAGAFDSIAVRTRVHSQADPGYAAFVASGGKVHVVPQAVLDAIPDK
ncbi:N-acetylmuramoyl-L-alanine amidase [Actinophytocola sediminis]